MKIFMRWRLAGTVLAGLAAVCALSGCGTYEGGAYVEPAGYYGYGPGWDGPDFYDYDPTVGYWGGDYYEWGHHRYGRLDHGFYDRQHTAHFHGGSGFHSGGAVHASGGFHGGATAHGSFGGGAHVSGGHAGGGRRR